MTEKDFRQFINTEPMEINPNITKNTQKVQQKATYINGNYEISKSAPINENFISEAAVNLSEMFSNAYASVDRYFSEADGILSDARAEAENIVETANRKAADIVTKAQAEGEEIRRRVENEFLEKTKSKIDFDPNNIIDEKPKTGPNGDGKFPTVDQIIAEQRRLKKIGRVKRTLRNTFAVLTVIAAVTVLLVTMCFPVFQIYGTSMEPIFNDGEIAVAVKNSDFDNGSIIAFYCNNEILVKRVICGPGDLIDIDENGTVYVNDAELDEPYITEKNLGDCDITFPYLVPADSYFVMGDNRAVSIDSRSTLVGCVQSEQIIGRVVLCVWPIKSLSWIS